MSDDGICYSREGTAASHCWHKTNMVLTSNPPQNVEQCCYCGQRRNVVMLLYKPELIGHGPHHPDLVR